MIEDTSTAYGDKTYHPTYGEAAPVIARRQNLQHYADVVRTCDPHSLALVLYSKRPDAEEAGRVMEPATKARPRRAAGSGEGPDREQADLPSLELCRAA